MIYIKWEKLGRIFVPQDNNLNYAKSPQAMVFDDYVRVYFCPCKQDGQRVKCYVAYADFTKDFKTMINFSKDVISDGTLGCYDEHGIFPFSPVKYNDSIYAYISGCSRRKSVSVDTGIGLAISIDKYGNKFERLGNGPVVTSSLFEPFMVLDGFVKEYNGYLHMWYIYGTEWNVFRENEEPDRTYKIGHAKSSDGINWVKDGIQIIPDKFEYESQALPTVIYANNKYHMFFSYRHSYDFRTNSKRSYRIGYAYSKDLISWTRNDELVGIDVSDEGWDSEMMCYPNVFEMDKSIYLLYNGNEFGKHGFGIAKLIEF